MIDEMLIPELRRIHEEIHNKRTDAEECTDDVTKEALRASINEKIEMLKNMAESIMNYTFIARKEGILCLEWELENLAETPENALLKEGMLLIIDGIFPEKVERVLLINYFSTKMDPYMALIGIMSIYGVLSIQAGERPDIIYKMIQGMMPDGVVLPDKEVLLEKQKERREQIDIDLDVVCKGDIRIKHNNIGYLEVRICNNIICSLSNVDIQRVISEIYGDFIIIYTLKGLSGEARRAIFDNISKEKISWYGSEIMYDDSANPYVTDEYTLRKIRDSASKMLSCINRLHQAGEIIITVDPETQLMSWILEQNNHEEERKNWKKQKLKQIVELLIDSDSI